VNTIGNRGSRSFGGEGRRSRNGDDHRHLTAYQLCRQRRQSIILAFGKAVFDRNIAPLDVTGFGQGLPEYRQHARGWRRRPCAKIANHRHRRLLGARASHLDGEQQTGATGQCHKFTPLHVEHGDFLPCALSAPTTDRALGLPHAQPTAGRPASPWGRPELF
jgi:hypothetical protein